MKTVRYALIVGALSSACVSVAAQAAPVRASETSFTAGKKLGGLRQGSRLVGDKSSAMGGASIIPIVAGVFGAVGIAVSASAADKADDARDEARAARNEITARDVELAARKAEVQGLQNAIAQLEKKLGDNARQTAALEEVIKKLREEISRRG